MKFSAHLLKAYFGIASCLLPLAALGQEATPFGQRNVLVEVFSTERCTNCPAGHETLAYALGGKTNVIELVHHAGFFTDKFTIPESTAYEWFYKSADYSTSFAPAFMMDRTHWDALPDYYYYPTPVSMSFGSKALKAAYAAAAEVPALASICIVPSYSADNRLLALDVEAEALVAAGYEQPALNVFLVENDVFSKSQEGSFGSYTHQHLVRQCLTTTWGESLSLADDEGAASACATINRHYEVTLPDDWNAQNMTAVAFVANYNARSNADCRVMNAEETSITTAVPDAVLTPPTSATADSSIYNIIGQPCSPRTTVPGVYVKNHKKVIL